MPIKLKAVLFHLKIFIVVAPVLALPFHCPFLWLTHIPCPTCGMTRSLLSLLRLDIASSLNYNPATIPFIFLLWFAVHKNLYPASDKIKEIIVIGGSVTLFITYLIRLRFFDFLLS